MKCSFYLKNLLRMYILKNKSIDGIENVPFIYNRLLDESKSKSKDKLENFIYKAIGYADDDIMSSRDRYLLRKEVTQSSKDPSYWSKKQAEMGFNRSSKLIEHLEYLRVLGVVYNDKDVSKVGSKEFLHFVENNKELIELVANSLDTKTSLSYSNKEVRLLDIVTLVNKSSISIEDNGEIVGLGTNISDIIKVVPSERVCITDYVLYVDKKTYRELSSEKILKYTVEAIAKNLHVHEPAIFASINKHLINAILMFSKSDDAVLELIDLVHLTNKSIDELLYPTGVKFPEFEDMEKCYGIYIYNGSTIRYIPDSCREYTGVPCEFLLEDFVKVVNTGLVGDIVYVGGIPKLNNMYINKAHTDDNQV